MTRYQQTRFLGSGTYARVYEAIDTLTSQRVALKKTIINLQDGFPATSLREISLLKSLKHPNIINLLNILHTPRMLVIVFEYFEYDLKRYLSTRSINVFPLIVQLLRGVDYMHKNKVIHRDLKPQNILVNSNGVLKIADFGLARTSIIELKYNNEVVTLWYRSLELLKGLQNYDGFIDMWSVGCIFYEMIINVPLFTGRNEEDQIRIIKNAFKGAKIKHIIMDKIKNMPGFVYSILFGCLNLNYYKRLTAEECLQIIDKEKSAMNQKIRI